MGYLDNYTTEMATVMEETQDIETGTVGADFCSSSHSGKSIREVGMLQDSIWSFYTLDNILLTRLYLCNDTVSTC